MSVVDTSKVPFYSNTPDDTHCFQAAFKMVLGYFMPERSFGWEELEDMSAKVEGLATWPQAMMLQLNQLGFDIVMVEGFDGKAFAEQGETYLTDTFGQETADWQIKNSDIAQEQRLYKQLLDSDVHIECRVPELPEIVDYLDQGYLIICTVNSHSLNNRPGYVGHAVVIYDHDEKAFILHDPGLPPQPNRLVSFELFEQAWADPNQAAKNYMALRLKEKK